MRKDRQYERLIRKLPFDFNMTLHTLPVALEMNNHFLIHFTCNIEHMAISYLTRHRIIPVLVMHILI